MPLLTRQEHAFIRDQNFRAIHSMLHNWAPDTPLDLTPLLAAINNAVEHILAQRQANDSLNPTNPLSIDLSDLPPEGHARMIAALQSAGYTVDITPSPPAS